MRAHSGETRTAREHWRDRMGRYGEVHVAYGGDVLDTG